MQAEERYGRGGYQCASKDRPLSAVRHANRFRVRILDIGNGTYEPLYGHPGAAPPAQAPVNYGATGGNYVR